MTKSDKRSPAAFRLDDPDVLVEDPNAPAAPGGRSRAGSRIVVAPEPDVFTPPVADAHVPVPRRGFAWGRLFASATGALVVFAAGVWVTDFVTSLFARNDALGTVALVLAALAGISILAVVLREVTGLMRLARVTRMRAEAEQAAVSDDRDEARRITRAVVALYAGRPQTARARAAVLGHVADIIDGRDLLRLAEAELMSGLDAEARALVTGAARRVSVVTAVSPRALVDVGYVLYETTRLVRRIGALYGGRPTGLSLLRLVRLSLAHLAVTGGIAVTDGLVQQIVGHGLAARLSARLGEGVVNGMMTARIGLAALDVCRPLPWIAATPPGLSDVMSVLVSSGQAGTKGD